MDLMMIRGHTLHYQEKTIIQILDSNFTIEMLKDSVILYKAFYGNEEDSYKNPFNIPIPKSLAPVKKLNFAIQ